jgi:hypothetical protein
LRSLLLAAVSGSGLSLRALHSEDVDPAGKVEIRATLVGQGPQDLALERVVSRLSLEARLQTYGGHRVLIDLYITFELSK